MNGYGLVENHAQAAQWFRLAAEQGHPDAQFNIGRMHLDGDGVPQDAFEAYRWIGLSIPRFVAGEDVMRDTALTARNTAAAALTAAQIAEAEVQIENWSPQLGQ
jgi:TPR repeat protein